MIAKITIETSEGSVTRHYNETMLLNGEIDTQAEVESMTQNIINGARGSSSSFDRFNLKMITGHEHTPKMYGNGMVVGTSTHLKLSYTKGAGSWMNAHGILYKSGKYALLTLV